MAGFKLFSTKIAPWGSSITMRAYDEEDAEELARALFKVPTDVEVTATEEIAEPESELAARLTKGGNC